MLEYVIPFKQSPRFVDKHVANLRPDLSSIPQEKLHILVSLIRISMFRMTASDCLLYANERSTCNSLRDFLRKSPLLVLPPTSDDKLLVEVLSEDPIEAAMSLALNEEDQVRILMVPRDAEDFDIPQVRVVIRFDVGVDPLSYAWSRAAVKDGGLLCQMMEEGNDNESNILTRTCQVMGQEAVRAWSRTLNSLDGLFCPPATLPPPLCLPRALDQRSEVIVDPVTGGIIGPSDAISTVLRIASCFANKRPTRPLLSYNCAPRGVHMCTIHMPDAMSEDIIASSTHSRAHARRVACFRVCQILQMHGALASNYFRPVAATVSQNQTPIVTNNKFNRKTPTFWDRCSATPASRLFPTLLHLALDADATSSAKGVNFFILTTQRLPPLFPFYVYRTGSTTSNIEKHRVLSTQGDSFSISGSQLDQLHRYTLKVTRLITNRRFVCSLDKMTYYIAPCKPLRGAEMGCGNSILHDDIDWHAVQQSLAAWIAALTLEDINGESHSKELVVQERAVEFTQHFFVKAVRRDLTPLSKPEQDSRESQFSSYLDAARTHSQNAEKITENRQPLIEIEMVPILLNALTPFKQSMPNPSKVARFLIPQLCFKLGLSAQIFNALAFIPAIVEHLSLQLLANELHASLVASSDITTRSLFPSLIGRSSLMDVDYERLEFFGDAYLKYISGLYVFMMNPSQSEKDLDLKRRDIVSNKTLAACGARAGVAPYIHLRAFATKSWRPLHYEIACDPSKEDREHAKASSVRDELPLDLERQAKLIAGDSGKANQPAPQAPPSNYVGEKIIADVVEALLGTAYLSGGPGCASRMLHALQIPLPHLDRIQDCVVRAQRILNAGAVNMRREALHAVEMIIGFPIVSPRLFERALTFGLNEQLEFVGDAVLDLLVCQYIYRRFPSQPPGVLTMMKNAMTSNIALSAITVHLGLHRQVSGLTPSIAHAVQVYATNLDKARGKDQQDSERDGRKLGQYWSNLEGPKATADVLEATIAAIFIDDNCNIDGSVRTFFTAVLQPFYDKHVSYNALAYHPAKVLYTMLHGHGCNGLTFDKELVEGKVACNISLHGIPMANATAVRASAAVRDASARAVEVLETNPGALQGCVCRAQPENRKKQTEAIRMQLQPFAESDNDMKQMMPS